MPTAASLLHAILALRMYQSPGSTDSQASWACVICRQGIRNRNDVSIIVCPAGIAQYSRIYNFVRRLPDVIEYHIGGIDSSRLQAWWVNERPQTSVKGNAWYAMVWRYIHGPLQAASLPLQAAALQRLSCMYEHSVYSGRPYGAHHPIRNLITPSDAWQAGYTIWQDCKIS